MLWRKINQGRGKMCWRNSAYFKLVMGGLTEKVIAGKDLWKLEE